MKKKVTLAIGLLVCCIAVICAVVHAQQPITDGNGDGQVNMQDFANMANDWLTSGYAGLGSNARIDVGFYTGNGTSANTIQMVLHYLERVPDFILVFPLSATHDIFPAIILNDGDDTKIKFFNNRDCDVFEELMSIEYNNFKVTNITTNGSFWLNRDGDRYFYVAVSKEIPAMP